MYDLRFAIVFVLINGFVYGFRNQQLPSLQLSDPCPPIRLSVPLPANLRSQPLIHPNVMGEGLSQQQRNGLSSSVSHHQMNPSFYPSDQQVGRDQSLWPPDQMQGNAFCMPGLP